MNESARSSAWSTFLTPDGSMLDSRTAATRLVECGRGWDAVVVSPLSRGLAALDLLNLPTGCGYPVLADYSRDELIVQVSAGTADACAGIQGVRTLSAGSYLLIPAEGCGALAATWLSAPDENPRFVDVDKLRRAVLTAIERADTATRLSLTIPKACRLNPP